MRPSARTAARRPRGLITALVVASALFLIEMPVFAAAPPVANPVIPEIPGPAGLFDPVEIHTDPVRMALHVFAAGSTPTGAWSAASVVCAGDHPRVRSWRFEGVLTNRVTRIQCGVGTVLLAGFRGLEPGLAAVAQLAALKAGDDAQCWALRDTDRFHALPKKWLNAFTDGKDIGVGGLEAEIYSRVLTQANYTSAAALKKAARSDITYSHIFNDPDVYRGEVVHVEGILKRINRFPPPYEAAQEGVNDLYEAWVFSEFLGSNPYCVVFTEWPAGLPRDLLGKEALQGKYRVTMDGYFIKKFRYEARDGRKTQRDAPFLVGHTLTVISTSSQATAESPWMQNLIYGIVGVFAALFTTVVGLTWWFRRTDNRVRRRLLAVRTREFVLPTPDALPVAAPMAVPARRAGNQGTAQRIAMPSVRAERHIEPPSSSEEGGRGSPEDKPPEEGAGA